MSQAIEAYPWFLNKHVEIAVDEQPVRMHISNGAWQDHWRPFLARLYALHEGHRPRLLVAIGGPPGSGKSIFAQQLAWIIEKIGLKGCHAMALPMDGFHFPTAYLQEHQRTLEGGVQVPLLNYKGAPDTFNVAGLKERVALLRTVPREAGWPNYSRIAHDVVENHFHLTASVNLVLVEGNYMLLNRGPWKGLPELFDLRIYIDAPAAVILSNLMARHIRGGRPPGVAKEWVKRIDLPNARLAESTKANADVIIERSGPEDVVSVTWGKAPPAAPPAAAPAAPSAAPPADEPSHR